MKQTDSIMHLMIIWSKAEEYKDYIIEAINDEFHVVKVFNVFWGKNRFKRNLSVFYSHSLKDIPLRNMDLILNNKQKNVGDRGFYVIVFEDTSPVFEERQTTSGVRIVNSHVFDKKINFRKMTGGSSRIHCSDDAWETNKDLTILFGLNINDFLLRYEKHSEIVEEYRGDCLGVDGYDSIQQFFYVLNNTINYCVLRNHECLPDTYTVEGHGDIDLLVEHRDYAIRLTSARPVFPQDYRVYHIIKIGGKEIPFDFRYVGDNYYDPKWEEDILRTRIFQKNLFYAPDSLNQYHSLLYHAYVQKPYVKRDYLPKLALYAGKCGLNFCDRVVPSLMQICEYLTTKKYEFVRPNDITVYYNEKNIKNLYVWRELAGKHGIDNLRQVCEDYNSLSDFYYFRANYKGRDCFIKYGGVGETCYNEFEYTNRIYIYSKKHIIEPIEYGKGEFGDFIIFEWVEGISVEEYLGQNDMQRKEDVKKQLIEIYNSLQDVAIMHRDIRPDNLMVVGGVVKLIDFQYAIDANHTKELDCIKNNTNVMVRLGNRQFRYKPYAWKDSASIVKCMRYFGISVIDLNLISDRAYYKSIVSIYKTYMFELHIKLSKLKRMLFD